MQCSLDSATLRCNDVGTTTMALMSKPHTYLQGTTPRRPPLLPAVTTVSKWQGGPRTDEIFYHKTGA